MRARASALLGNLVQRMAGEAARELVDFVHEVLVASVGEDYEWPGNVRELEQAVRRILITRSYEPQRIRQRDPAIELARRMHEGAMNADELLSNFCAALHERFGTFEEVARRANLDARTVKRYLAQHRERHAKSSTTRSS